MENLISQREFYLNRANSYLNSNNYSEALVNYEKVKSLLGVDEKDFELHRLKSLDGIAWTKARMERYKEALKDCNELIAYAFPKKLLLPKFFTVRACCYKELGNIIFAERSFDIANNQLLINMVLTEEGDESFATGFTAIGYNALGNRYFIHNLLNEALINYDNAIELHPCYATALFNKGVALSKINNHQASIQAYSLCIKYDANNTSAYLNRGNEYCYCRDFKSAIKDYDFCLAKNPRDELAIENKEYAKSFLF
jgi:tetratricopeptide (TPR) repeat protein